MVNKLTKSVKKAINQRIFAIEYQRAARPPIMSIRAVTLTVKATPIRIPARRNSLFCKRFLCSIVSCTLIPSNRHTSATIERARSPLSSFISLASWNMTIGILAYAVTAKSGRLTKE